MADKRQRRLCSDCKKIPVSYGRTIRIRCDSCHKIYRKKNAKYLDSNGKFDSKLYYQVNFKGNRKKLEESYYHLCKCGNKMILRSKICFDCYTKSRRENPKTIEEKRVYSKKYYEENKKEIRNYHKKYYEKTKEERKIYNKKRAKILVETLSDGYVAGLITRNSILKVKDVPTELIELKRKHLLLKRGINNYKQSSMR